MTLKIMPLIFLLLFLYSCSSKEDEAQKLIRIELSKSMNDYRSYESVEFGKLDSTFSEPKRQFTGYYIRHKFRGKNAVGGVILNHYSFYFNKDLTMIIKIQDNFALQDELEGSHKRNKAILEKLQNLGY